MTNRTATTGRRGSHRHRLDREELITEIIEILPVVIERVPGLGQPGGPAGRAIWGRIIGNINNQRDLIALIGEGGGGGAGPAGFSLEVSETVATGLVNVHIDAAVAKVRQAVATTWNRRATGYVAEGAASGNVTVFPLTGIAEVFSGLDPGKRYYLSATDAGTLDECYPTETEGRIIQPLGVAVAANALLFAPEFPLVMPGEA